MATKLSDRLVERMPWLDGVSGALQKIVDPIVGESAPQSLKDALVGVWLGHPLHPAVVLAPMGFWTSSFALDLANEERSADLLLALGLLSATPAVATGAAQWFDATNDEKPRRLGALHATVNTIGTGLYIASLIARKRGNRGLGIALSTAGLTAVNAGGWLGGDLAYDLGIGVNHEAFQEPPTEWIEVIDERELEAGKPKRVEAKGAKIMLLKHDDGIHAIGAVCPHLGGPLNKGKIDGETVTCPWHGSVFDLRDGRLCHGPATAPVQAYEVRVQDGQVSVRAAR